MSAPRVATSSIARRALHRTSARLALAILVVFAGGAIGAKQLAPYDPNAQPNAVTEKYLPPAAAHPFGTDPYSRDVLSRVIWGARVSLGVAVASVLLAVTLGVAVGAVAGYAGGWVDTAAMRFVDAVLSVPRIFLLLACVATIGAPTVGGIILLLGLTGWPGMSRIVRGEVRSLLERDWVRAARATGVPGWRILVRHILPGVVPHVIVAATLSLATVIPLEAGLSYLGFGVQRPTASWGNIILDGHDRAGDAWWIVLFPGLAIVLTVLAVNALGDALRDAVDPRQLPAR